MAGVYIHIPFCRQACHYCNFHFSTSLRYKNEFIAALLKELDLFKSVPQSAVGELIQTIYFGGGTPSLLDVADIKSILEKVMKVFTVENNVEVTLEANPDDIVEEKLEGWKMAGINRLSIGVQSFFDDDLEWMNRAHNSQQAVESLKIALRYFPNMSVDLIYGTPQLTDDRWKHNVDQLISLGIPHISCYALTVEPKTPLEKMIRQHRSPDVDQAKQSNQFLALVKWLQAAGYEHYEISNFAKPGLRSRHNSSYWQNESYYGFGPSAHSFDGKIRWWNVANNTAYIRSIEEGKIPSEKEELSQAQRVNEYIMISLRTMEGLDLDRLKEIVVKIPGKEGKSLNPDFVINDVKGKSRKYMERGLLRLVDNTILLTEEGKLMADGITADFFEDE